MTEDPIPGVIPGVTGYTVAELRAIWASMLDGSVWPIREKRLACMAVGLVNQLQSLRDAP